MKHDLLFIQLDTVIRSKFFATSFDVWDSFFSHYEITPDVPAFQIQLDLFEDPALLIDYSDKSVTAFHRINDLGTILLIKYIALRYNEYGFNFFIQEESRRRLQGSVNDLFNSLLSPLSEAIMRKTLTYFN